MDSLMDMKPIMGHYQRYKNKNPFLSHQSIFNGTILYHSDNLNIWLIQNKTIVNISVTRSSFSYNHRLQAQI
jgi:hypothetical protein